MMAKRHLLSCDCEICYNTRSELESDLARYGEAHIKTRGIHWPIERVDPRELIHTEALGELLAAAKEEVYDKAHKML